MSPDQPRERTLTEFVNEGIGFALRHYRRIIALSLILGVVGYALSYLIPVKYVASATLMPPSTNSAVSGMLAQLGSVSGMLGLDDGGSLSRIYPDIVKSRSVLGSVLKREYQDRSLPSWLGWEEGSDEASRLRQIDSLERMIHVRNNIRTGLIVVSSRAGDPELAAFLVNVLLEETETFILQNLSSEAASQVESIEARLDEVARSLEIAENELKEFREANINVALSPSLSLVEERLRRDVTIRSETYIALTKQLELAKLQERDSSPVVRVLDSAARPLKAAWPPRAKIAALGLALGLFLAVATGWLKDNARTG